MINVLIDPSLMAKNDLHVGIPAYFQCPISLEVMKSPVALCTGITYDRSSIQTWLDAGNLTCPATMQPLSSADFVPNLSLHRLIHLWSLSRPSPRSPSPHHHLCLLINRFAAVSATAASFKELSLHLSSLLRLAKNSVENRGVLVNSERFVASLADSMCEFDLNSGADVEFLELAVMALDLVSRESDKSREQIHKLFFKSDLSCLSPIASVLRAGNTKSRIAAANFLQTIAIDTETKRKIADTQDLVGDLYGLVISNDDSSIEAGLSTLISLATTRSFKSELLGIGAVRTLGNILAGSDRTAPVIIKAMEMAELLARCATGRSAICDDEKCVAEIVRRLMKVPGKATEHGVIVLWSVCHLFRSKKAVAAAIGSNGLTKCLLVMQSNCSPIARQMCRDLVKVFRVDSVALGLTSYNTKTTHIMPC